MAMGRGFMFMVKSYGCKIVSVGRRVKVVIVAIHRKCHKNPLFNASLCILKVSVQIAIEDFSFFCKERFLTIAQITHVLLL